jgi:hypothetical protein
MPDRRAITGYGIQPGESETIARRQFRGIPQGKGLHQACQVCPKPLSGNQISSIDDVTKELTLQDARAPSRRNGRTETPMIHRPNGPRRPTDSNPHGAPRSGTRLGSGAFGFDGSSGTGWATCGQPLASTAVEKHVGIRFSTPGKGRPPVAGAIGNPSLASGLKTHGFGALGPWEPRPCTPCRTGQARC